ncbi:hypothetical protein EDWATA_00822 [Edwardsiella tarda ATCC 23685]|uniref:Uncharacterized protein n=1 Tax=Edwardsiella tarda ATCC 23685 TaxID=500638 RepID=D4F278_EDWTA|nr:hypothetical protein EDWATA_00822 [Edwardsiella tarda ATCC 23685]
MQIMKRAFFNKTTPMLQHRNNQDMVLPFTMTIYKLTQTPLLFSRLKRVSLA